MENNSNPINEPEMNQSASSSPDMRDWELFDSDIVLINDTAVKENVENVDENNSRPSGLFIHESSTLHSGVEELAYEQDQLHHNESNTSSDIDVLDECIEENLSNISIPSMDISFSPSEISTSMSASNKESMSEVRNSIESQDAVSQTLTEPASAEPLHQRLATGFGHVMAFLRLVIDAVNTFHGDRMSSKDYFVIGFVVSLCLLVPCTHIVLHKASWQEAKLEQMEDHVNKLLTENEHLKSKVLEKIESGKLFGDLDEEVKDLRSQNFKLHKAMQIVIHQLEEQTQAIRKGLDSNENINKNPYKKEVFKLKEQINMLRIDNEELQKELVKIRYGKHPSYQENHRGEEKKKSDESDFSEKENSFDDIRETKEEIKQLRKKLDHEVNKLKIWKESLEELVEEMEKSRGNEDTGEEKRKFKQSHENFKQKTQKNRKFYNWSWKDIKKNVKGTFQNFPNMISNYVLFDKKNVDSVFNTISHYYKKAHDKTKKILDSYSVDEKTQNVKNDIWTLMGEMKNKWINMKNDFIATHFKGKDDHEKTGDTTDAHFKKSNLNERETMTQDRNADSKEEEGLPNADTKNNNADSEENAFEETMKSVADLNELIKEAGRRFTRHKMHIDNWLFNRAQHRADLRENDEKIQNSDDINWYLRKGKSTENSDTK